MYIKIGREIEDVKERLQDVCMQIQSYLQGEQRIMKNVKKIYICKSASI